MRQASLIVHMLVPSALQAVFTHRMLVLSATISSVCYYSPTTPEYNYYEYIFLSLMLPAAYPQSVMADAFSNSSINVTWVAPTEFYSTPIKFS